MINNIPEELRAKLKGKEKELVQAIMEARKMAEEDLLAPNEKLYDRIPKLVSYVRQTIAAVAQASVECQPARFKNGRDAWYKPFEDIVEVLKYAEYRIVKDLRDHE